jgi:hypothetical protein
MFDSTSWKAILKEYEQWYSELMREKEISTSLFF